MKGKKEKKKKKWDNQWILSYGAILINHRKQNINKKFQKKKIDLKNNIFVMTTISQP